MSSIAIGAIATGDYPSVTQPSSPDNPSFLIPLRVSATNGTTASVGEVINITIPAGTKRSHFNDIIIQAIITWAATHTITVEEKDVFFQSFDNG